VVWCRADRIGRAWYAAPMRRMCQTWLGVATLLAVTLACVSEDAPLPATKDAGPSCAADQKACLGRCVKIDDPLYGCDPTKCAACPEAPYVESVTCSQGRCAVAKCKLGRGDCNTGTGAEGCETNLTLPSTCGSCTKSCPVDKPYCSFEESSGVASCSADCLGGLTGCSGNVCANLQTSNTHCGKCDNACVPPNGGEANCKAGTCEIVCFPGLSLSGSNCRPDSSTCLLGDGACKVGEQCCSGTCVGGKCTACAKKGESCGSVPCCTQGMEFCVGTNGGPRTCLE
jgi:hypothetical protein